MRFQPRQGGPILPPPAGKTRITIRIDDNILEWFRVQGDAAEGRKSYQSMINQALREFMVRDRAPLEHSGRVVREELAHYTVNPTSELTTDDPGE